MKLIIDIPEEEWLFIKAKIAIEDDSYIDRAIANGTPIPDNATNGDMIKAMFPNIQISDSEVMKMKNIYTGIPYGELIGANIDCMREWWNAPYYNNK